MFKSEEGNTVTCGQGQSKKLRKQLCGVAVTRFYESAKGRKE